VFLDENEFKNEFLDKKKQSLNFLTTIVATKFEVGRQQAVKLYLKINK
jgi:hypothetical protein